MKCFRESPRAGGADALHLEPFLGLGFDDGGKCPEVPKERPSTHYRDARHGRKRGLGGRLTAASLRPLGVCRCVSVPHLRAAYGKSEKPESGIGGAVRADDAHTEVHESDPEPTYRRSGQRAVVDVVTLDHQIWKARHGTQSADLRPKGSVQYCGVQPSHRLALHNRPVADDVVTPRNAADLDAHAELCEEPWHAARLLEHIRNDRDSHNDIVATESEPIARKHVPSRQQLALSWSESA
jgi:hypothetical protein